MVRPRSSPRQQEKLAGGTKSKEHETGSSLRARRRLRLCRYRGAPSQVRRKLPDATRVFFIEHPRRRSFLGNRGAPSRQPRMSTAGCWAAFSQASQKSAISAPSARSLAFTKLYAGDTGEKTQLASVLPTGKCRLKPRIRSSGWLIRTILRTRTKLQATGGVAEARSCSR